MLLKGKGPSDILIEIIGNWEGEGMLLGKKREDNISLINYIVKLCPKLVTHHNLVVA